MSDFCLLIEVDNEILLQILSYLDRAYVSNTFSLVSKFFLNFIRRNEIALDYDYFENLAEEQLKKQYEEACSTILKSYILLQKEKLLRGRPIIGENQRGRYVVEGSRTHKLLLSQHINLSEPETKIVFLDISVSSHHLDNRFCEVDMLRNTYAILKPDPSHPNNNHLLYGQAEIITRHLSYETMKKIKNGTLGMHSEQNNPEDEGYWLHLYLPVMKIL